MDVAIHHNTTDVQKLHSKPLVCHPQLCIQTGSWLTACWMDIYGDTISCGKIFSSNSILPYNTSKQHLNDWCDLRLQIDLLHYLHAYVYIYTPILACTNIHQCRITCAMQSIMEWVIVCTKCETPLTCCQQWYYRNVLAKHLTWKYLSILNGQSLVCV